METGVLICLLILAAGLPFAKITFSREVGIVLGCVFWGLRLILAKKWDLVRTPLDLPLALLFAAGVLSLFFAVDWRYSLHELRGEMLKGIIVFYLAVNNIRTETRGRSLLAALLLTVVVMDVYGLIHFLVADGSFFTPVIRETSLHKGSQEFTTYLVQTAPFILAGILTVKQKLGRRLLAALLVLHLVAAYITFSRIAIVVLIFEAALLWIMWGKPWKLMMVALAALLLTVSILMPRPILLVGANSQNDTRIGRVGVAGLKDSRLMLWERALGHLSRHPVAGTGYGRRSFVMKYPELMAKNSNLWHTHNVFLNVAVEMGIQGLLIFLFLIWRITRGLWPDSGLGEGWLKGGLVQSFGVAAVVMTAGYMLRNMTDDIFNNDSALLFWLLVGCAFSLKIFKKEKNATPPGPAKA